MTNAETARKLVEDMSFVAPELHEQLLADRIEDLLDSRDREAAARLQGAAEALERVANTMAGDACKIARDFLSTLRAGTTPTAV